MDPLIKSQRIELRTESRQLVPVLMAQVPRKLSNNIVQKGLAFLRERSGTVVIPGRPTASKDPAPPAYRRGGASVVRREAVINRTEDLDVICEEAITRKI